MDAAEIVHDTCLVTCISVTDCESLYGTIAKEKVSMTDRVLSGGGYTTSVSKGGRHQVGQERADASGLFDERASRRLCEEGSGI
eukprot:5326497-Pyramimonas_sp.AAC.1